MKSLGNKWKNFKCYLKKKYLDAVIASEDVLNISDPRVDSTQWKELLIFWRFEKKLSNKHTKLCNMIIYFKII